ncbi:hypothetical protein VTN31DRAFT_2866 [Thermomyces dupontii]|uniref:uncharacterized protein n=1 Tax=Talaromyces thermophilus TaxID=28565 RepID=UPI0037434F7E
MSHIDSDERPAKKRRFFDIDEPAVKAPDASSANSHVPPASWADSVATKAPAASQNGLGTLTPENGRPQANGFDTKLFSSIVGQDVPDDTISKVRQVAGNDMERAVNVFLDGSWQTDASSIATTTSQPSPSAPVSVRKTPEPTPPETPTKPVEEGPKVLDSMPHRRYIGSFGVAAWATRSGYNLVRHEEKVQIERTRLRPRVGRGGRIITSQKADILTRFTNSRGEEVGRLEQDMAAWISTLIDQRICEFDGVCVYAPERLKVNDTIYLQLKCFILRDAFFPEPFRNLDEDRAAGLFDQTETSEERDLRLRQVALVKLFKEINLQPTVSNTANLGNKNDGLLKSAEMAEQAEKNKKEKSKETTALEDGTSDEEVGELEEDQLDTLYKKAQSFDFNTPEAEPAETFRMNLRKYQKQALHWMLAKEKDMKLDRQASMHPLWEEYKWPVKDADDKPLPTVAGQDYFYVNPYSGELSLDFPVQEQHCLGGILADEMGLGKTIEMLSLMHTHRTTPEFASATPMQPETRNSTGIAPAPYTTLVVAPTSLLAQWESEAQKASIPGTMRTMIYYGAGRSPDLQELCRAENANEAPHMIITSYGVVLSDFRRLVSQGGPQSGHGLFSVEFFRIILDEAHLIKNRRAKSARACYELKGLHRWILTGTPIVNRLEDLYSLVKFLKVEPWCNFSFWRTFITVPFESKDYVRALNVVQTVLEPLVMRRTKSMRTPDGEPLVPLPRRIVNVEEIELSEQEREIYDLFYTRAKRTYNTNAEAGTLLKSYSTIFAQILRLRQTCCHPILTRNSLIVAEEEDAAVVAQAANEMKDDMDLQELIDRFTASTESDEPQDPMKRFTAQALRQIQNESSGECPICSEDPMIEPAVTSCWHSACKKCLEDYLKHEESKGQLARCVTCRSTITRRDIFEIVKHQSPSFTSQDDDLYSSSPVTPSQAPPKITLRRIHPYLPSARTSAKILALINHLTRLPRGTKSVVFSQFTTFLDLIGPQLTRAGIKFLRLDGTMSQKARAEVIKQFTNMEMYEEDELDEDYDLEQKLAQRKSAQGGASSTPDVLLISLKAGGVGLNLTAANNVFMMDPWWSFAVEAQAIDRVHRMGQTKDVTVTRFVVKDSIEVRMLRVQERKMKIAGTLGLRVGGDGSEEERNRERIEELRLLFE